MLLNILYNGHVNVLFFHSCASWFIVKLLSEITRLSIICLRSNNNLEVDPTNTWWTASSFIVLSVFSFIMYQNFNENAFKHFFVCYSLSSWMSSGWLSRFYSVYVKQTNAPADIKRCICDLLLYHKLADARGFLRLAEIRSSQLYLYLFFRIDCVRKLLKCVRHISNAARPHC